MLDILHKQVPFSATGGTVFLHKMEELTVIVNCNEHYSLFAFKYLFIYYFLCNVYCINTFF